MTALFDQVAAIDERLLDIPFGSEPEALALIAVRGQLIATLESSPVPAECASALFALQASTAALEQRYSHFRRRLSTEVGESGAHPQFLETLADSLEPPAQYGRILA